MDNELSQTTTEPLLSASSPVGSPRRNRQRSGNERSRSRSRSPIEKSDCTRAHSPSAVEQAESAARYAAQHAIKVAGQQPSPPMSPKQKVPDHMKASTPPLSTSSKSHSSLSVKDLSPKPTLNNGLPHGGPLDPQNPANFAAAAALSAFQNPNPSMQVSILFSQTSETCFFILQIFPSTVQPPDAGSESSARANDGSKPTLGSKSTSCCSCNGWWFATTN